jgi:PilZ domain
VLLKLIEGNNHPPAFADHAPISYIGPERRGKPRLYWRCPAMVQGGEKGGEDFEVNAVITNISASGLYMRFRKSVEPGAVLFLIMRFTNASAAEARGPVIIIHGRVMRVELQPDGECGVAVEIMRHEFA